MDQELQKFKLELEADHAGITSKLEQVLSSKPNHQFNSNALNYTLFCNNSTLSGINFNLNQLNDESDFTLCTQANPNGQDLVMMVMNNQNPQRMCDIQPNINSHHNKRKHSTSQQHSNMGIQSAHNDEDSSSSWQSAIYQGRKNSSGSGSNKKTSFSWAFPNKVRRNIKPRLLVAVY